MTRFKRLRQQYTLIFTQEGRNYVLSYDKLMSFEDPFLLRFPERQELYRNFKAAEALLYERHAIMSEE